MGLMDTESWTLKVSVSIKHCQSVEQCRRLGGCCSHGLLPMLQMPKPQPG